MKPLEQLAMAIILHGGNARALAHEALDKAKRRDFKGAQAKLRQAEKELGKGHDQQTKLLQREARGAGQSPTLLVAHALDHLMNAGSEKGLIAEIIELYQQK